MLVEVAVAVLHAQNRYWVQRRAGTGHLDGLWEFPGGKIETNESPREALQRELLEELGLEIEPQAAQRIDSITHTYSERTVRIHFFQIEFRTGQPAIDRPGRWVTVSELRELPTPAANQPILRLLNP